MNSSWRWSVLKRTYRSFSILSCTCAPHWYSYHTTTSNPLQPNHRAQQCFPSPGFQFRNESRARQRFEGEMHVGSGAAWRRRQDVTLAVSSAGRVAATAAIVKQPGEVSSLESKGLQGHQLFKS